MNENIGWPKRRGDTTQFVPIESLAGEPCRIKLDPKSPPREMTLKKGESVVFHPNGRQAAAVVEAAAAQPNRINTSGLR